MRPTRAARARAARPLPVAETFTFRDKATEVALNDVASLANLVTVVDAASVFEQLGTMDKRADRGWQAADGDQRTVAHLMCDQLEFANVRCCVSILRRVRTCPLRLAAAEPELTR